jgi:hypothetical protein
VNGLLVGERAQCGAEMIAPKWAEHVSDSLRSERVVLRSLRISV